MAEIRRKTEWRVLQSHAISPGWISQSRKIVREHRGNARGASGARAHWCRGLVIATQHVFNGRDGSEKAVTLVI